MALRQILFDTETTGFDPMTGDRMVEIGAIEVVDYLHTGKEFHYFINPERLIPAESTRIHGITDDMVKDAPLWSQVAPEFLEFIGDSDLVAHNADFDRSFINFQLEDAGFAPIEKTRFIDSLAIAKKKYPGQLNSLDALCRRFNIDLDVRKDRHGALLDSLLLADVWLELHGGRQISLFDSSAAAQKSNNAAHKENTIVKTIDKTAFANRCFTLKEDEQQRHAEFIAQHIKDSLWRKNS